MFFCCCFFFSDQFSQLQSTVSSSDGADSLELQFLRYNWKKLAIAMKFDLVWLAGEMNRFGLLSDYDHEDVARAKSLLNDTDKSEILMISLKRKVALDSKYFRTFLDILKAKPRMYTDAIHIIEGK